MTFKRSALEYKCKLILNIFEELSALKLKVSCCVKTSLLNNFCLIVINHYSYLHMVLVFIMLYSLIVVKNFKHFIQRMKFCMDEKFIMTLQNKNEQPKPNYKFGSLFSVILNKTD